MQNKVARDFRYDPRTFSVLLIHLTVSDSRRILRGMNLEGDALYVSSRIRWWFVRRAICDTKEGPQTCNIVSGQRIGLLISIGSHNKCIVRGSVRWLM